MKNFILILGLILVIFTIGYFLDMNSIPTIKEEVAIKAESIKIALPEFSFKTLENKETSIYKVFGNENKIIILNFWATWCAPCLEEFPYILETLSKNKDRLVLVAISNDESVVEIKKFLKRFKDKMAGLEHNIVIGLDPQKEISTNLFHVLKLPETFIIDENKNIVKKIVGSSAWTNGSTNLFE